MLTRIVTGVVLLAVWFGLIFINSYQLFWLTSVLLTLFCGWEFYTMHGERGSGRLAALVLTLLPVLSQYGGADHALLGGSLLLAFLLAACQVVMAASCRPPATALTNRLTGLIYIGFTLPHLALLFSLPQGNLWLLVLTAITAASDSGAYFSGKALGKHKLCPHISPGKTVEGFVGGMICGTAVATAMAAALLPEQNLLTLALAALLLACLGVVGDLTESVMKRATGSKDSGTLLPGHGGFLDRLDSMIFCAPALYYLISLGIL